MQVSPSILYNLGFSTEQQYKCPAHLTDVQGLVILIQDKNRRFNQFIDPIKIYDILAPGNGTFKKFALSGFFVPGAASFPRRFPVSSIIRSRDIKYKADAWIYHPRTYPVLNFIQ